MPLELSSAEKVPYLKYSPRDNEWSLSSEDGAYSFDWDGPAIWDVEKIELGWLLLDVGMREWEPWPDNKRTAKPDEREWKQGFICKVFSKNQFEDAPVRQFSSNGTGINKFITNLYNEAEKVSNRFADAKVPVVTITGADKESYKGRGSTKIPTFEIVKWVARPPELNGDEVGEASKPKQKQKNENPEFE
tara:strand:- start:900 stop:1469 length:570 start_codon:yes stop_codon:yes gene_type:complete